jgi:uncharacterized Ntn-hydrolase superfamily protein
VTYTVLASNPETQEIGIASTTITINFSRTFPIHGGLLPDWSPRGLICAPMATIHPQNGHKLCALWNEGVGFDTMENELDKFDPNWSWRQMGAVTGAGEVFAYTGADAWDHASHIPGKGSLALGNYMDGPGPVQAMAEALEKGKELPMDERLMRALEAGRAAGGQGNAQVGSVPEAFAMIQVFNGKQPWPAVDLRVDFDVAAVPKLRRLLTQTKRMDPVLFTMCYEPSKTFDVYDVVFEMYNAQV